MVALSLLWLRAHQRPESPPSRHCDPEVEPLNPRQPPHLREVYRDISHHPDNEQPPGIAVVRLDGDLFFATADAFEDRIRDVIHSQSGLDGIVLDCERTNFVDSQGSAKLAESPALLESPGSSSGSLGSSRR